MTSVKKRERFAELPVALPLQSSGMLQSPFIQLDARDGIHNMQLKNILYCGSQNGYTSFHTLTGKPVLVSNPLRHFERLLRNYGFKRVNEHYLVNLTRISGFFERKAGYELQLTDGKRIAVSRAMTKELAEDIQRMSVKESGISKSPDWQIMNEDFILNEIARSNDLTFRYSQP